MNKELHIIISPKGYGKEYYERKLSKEKYKQFKELYLEKFIHYYKDKNTNRKELKRAVFENPKLTGIQRKRFWEMIEKRSKNDRGRAKTKEN